MTLPDESFTAICPVCKQDFTSEFPISPDTLCEECFLEEAEAGEEE